MKSRDVSVEFPFELASKADSRGFADARGTKFVFLRDFVTGGDGIQSDLIGFRGSPTDYDIQVENWKTGAGFRITGERALARVLFWAIDTVFAPEAHVGMNIAPGKEFSWRIAYGIYTLTPTP